MSRFVFMLTRGDRTVPDAHAVYASVARGPLRCVGLKDVGLPLDELAPLVRAMKRDGKEVALEVVSTSPDDELRSVEAAVRLGVDRLLGGRRADEATRILRGTPIRYFPFAGCTVGHPTRLTGTIDEIVDDARRLAALPGVHGLDLLAYRYAGDAPGLARQVTRAVTLPVIAAGSIDTVERVQAMRRAGVWAFTVGSAVFDGRFGDAPVGRQVEAILGIEGVRA